MARGELTLDDVRRVARLARLRLDDEQVEAMRAELAAVLRHMERLSELDLSGVEPMRRPEAVGAGHDGPDALRDDEVGAALPMEVVAAMAPDRVGPFVRVPRVLGEGGA